MAAMLMVNTCGKLGAGEQGGERVNADRIAAGALPALVIVVLGFALAATDARSADRATYDQAVKLLESGRDNQQAVRLFEEVAVDGNIRAEFMLGAIYLEGKYVPQNRPLGLAYLQLAAQGNDPSTKAIRDKAQEWIRASQASFSGSELIEADRLAAQMEANLQSRLAAQFAPAMRVFTTETPIAFSPLIKFAREPVELLPPPAGESETRYRAGCAAGSRAKCPPASRAASDKRCTGQLVSADTAPSAAAEGAVLVEPVYPRGVSRAGDGVSVKMLSHVDSSGWICGTAIAVPSGTPSLDAAILEAVSKWKLKPAMKSGVPVESLYSLDFTYRTEE